MVQSILWNFGTVFLLITSVHLLAAASPGPDFVLVSQQTLAKGRRTGLICSLGITLGLAVHIIYSVLGLATVIAHSQPLLTTIKWLGGGYLIYLGWQGIQAKPKKPADLETAHLLEKNTCFRKSRFTSRFKHSHFARCAY
ncbi:LysE family translocator [Psychrobacter sp. JCM 18901]|uniref:LysE family translocator n=1 Tax=Psychrobacter sp. JCM 18901 TaxID=1298609 RepID=UPI0021C3F3DB|nr:LysE family translocator [Psychrobacter sp. JCM 18901]